MRGYLLTGKPRFLEPYARGAAGYRSAAPLDPRCRGSKPPRPDRGARKPEARGAGDAARRARSQRREHHRRPRNRGGSCRQQAGARCPAARDRGDAGARARTPGSAAGPAR
ncbi:hypothetical protein [Erythrobacter cryptus]|uniref:hypothetical protein n=1 Tax=Erythrobacter cryptus TaxID=196588 RepID=UPI003CCC2A58